MTAADIKKQIIKEMITPFFKNNGFSKKGVKYFNVTDFLIIEAEIQSQRYYTNKNIKNFRININRLPNINSNATSRLVSFGFHTISFSETSWITIDGNMNFEILKSKMKVEIDGALLFIAESNNLNRMIANAEEQLEYFKKAILSSESKLEQESNTQYWIDTLKLSIERNNERINMINDWLRIARGYAYQS